jgi:uracil phosphoribosyltransferase
MTAKAHGRFAQFYEVHHPLVQYKLSLLRDKNTHQKLFRELVHELTLLIGYEATQNLKTIASHVETPVETANVEILEDPHPVIVPILRAGVGMVEALLSLMPSAKVGHIGTFRNESTHEPENYYFKIPQDSHLRACYVCDPMLATGGSALQAVKQLKERGVKEITLICIIAAPEGVETFLRAHPDVTIYAAKLDRCLNEHAYILPGLGDAGDRLFGTL